MTICPLPAKMWTRATALLRFPVAACVIFRSVMLTPGEPPRSAAAPHAGARSLYTPSIWWPAAVPDDSLAAYQLPPRAASARGARLIPALHVVLAHHPDIRYGVDRP